MKIVIILLVTCLIHINVWPGNYTYIDPFGQYTIHEFDDASDYSTPIIDVESIMDSITEYDSNSEAYSAFLEKFQPFNGLSASRINVNGVGVFYDSIPTENINLINTYSSNDYGSRYFSEFQNISGKGYITINHNASTETVDGGTTTRDGENYNAIYWYDDDIFLEFGLVDGETLASFNIDIIDDEVQINDFNYPFRYIVNQDGEYFEFCGNHNFANYNAEAKTVTTQTYNCDDGSTAGYSRILFDLTTGSYTVIE